MTLWLILTIMTSAAVVWLTVPLLRRFDRPRDEMAGDIAVYRDQLEEVGRDLRDGRIDAAQAETARTEIKRRILAASRPLPADPPGLSGRERSFVIVSATAIVALGSAILYATIGNPDLASIRSSSSSAPLFAGEARAGAAAPPASGAFPPWHPALEGFADADRDGEPQTGLPTVEEMTRRLAARLARNPDDTEGWRTLAWSYLNIGRFDEAANAYAKAIERDPGNAEFRGGHIEALVGAANGVVTPEARAAIGDALKLHPKDARARYFAGMASEQEGGKAAALAAWTELLNDTGAGGSVDESLASDLKSRVAELKREMGSDGGAPAAGAKPAMAAPTPRPSRVQGGDEDTARASRAAEKGPTKGPSPQDVQAADAMPTADRTAMIRGMVDSLASRLERSPRDVDGWIRLIRSRVVLGESDLARQALARGLAAFADGTPERDRIAATAQKLGVGQ